MANFNKNWKLSVSNTNKQTNTFYFWTNGQKSWWRSMTRQANQADQILSAILFIGTEQTPGRGAVDKMSLSLSSSFSCFSQNDPFVILRTLMNSYSAPSIWFALLQIYSSFSLTLQERPLSALFKIEITHTHPWHCLSSFLFFLYIYCIYGLLPYYTFYLITFIVVCLLFV